MSMRPESYAISDVFCFVFAVGLFDTEMGARFFVSAVLIIRRVSYLFIDSWIHAR